MKISKFKLYAFFLIACFFSYAWIIYQFYFGNNHNEFTVCFFKNVTSLPCPSCGSSRSIIALLNGNFLNSILINPLGIIITLFLIICPILILYDLILKKDTFYNLYTKTEINIKKPSVYIILIVLFLVNWIWNFTKNL